MISSIISLTAHYLDDRHHFLDVACILLDTNCCMMNQSTFDCLDNDRFRDRTSFQDILHDIGWNIYTYLQVEQLKIVVEK